MLRAFVRERIIFLSEDVVLVSYDDKSVTAQRTLSCPIVSALITAYCRIYMWKCLNQLGSSVLYTDTDSLVFELGANTEGIEFNDSFLGCFKSELGAPENVITKWVATAPKSYSYTVKSVKTGELIKSVSCIKGFSLHMAAAKILNLETMFDLLMAFSRDQLREISVTDEKFVKDKHFRIHTRSQTRVFKITFDKRVLRAGDLTQMTLPIGYRDLDESSPVIFAGDHEYDGVPQEEQ